jgi:tetratricopeptide (TPR) repeat protein
MQGRYCLKGETIEDWVRAMGYFEQATRLDSGFAPAWAGLGDSRVQLAAWGYFPPVEGYGKGREAVERALVLDPNLADAYAVRGRIQRHFDWDWDASEASYKQALALEPGSAHIIESAAWLKGTLGHWDEAVALARRAVELDPLSEGSHDTLITMLRRAGRFEEARAAYTKLRELNPSMPEQYWGDVLQWRPQEALTRAEHRDHPGFRLQGMALAYHALGRKRESDAALAELIKNHHPEMAYQIAEVYAFRGEADNAFEWLERAYDQRDPGLPPHLKGDLWLKNIRGDPRYTALLKKMRLPLD